MEKAMIVQNTITINAPIDAVWDMLVNPEKTRIYMYGCETISDWAIGSPLLWQGEYEGEKMVFVKGFIEDLNPPFLLKYTVFDPNSTMEDIQQNYLHVTYRLAEENGKTVLTVIQDGFEAAARGQERYEEVYNKGEGWNPILQAIANLLENP